MEHTVTRSCLMVSPAARALARRRLRYDRERGPASCSRPPRWCRPGGIAGLLESPATAGSNRRRPPSHRRRRADGLEFVRSTPPAWCAADVRGIRVDRRRAARACCATRRPPLMSTTSRPLSRADRRQRAEGGATARHNTPTAARAPHPDHVARCLMREVRGGLAKPARRRVPRLSCQGKVPNSRAHKKNFISMTPFPSWRYRITVADEVGRDALHDGFVRVEPRTQMSTLRASSPPAMRGGFCMAPILGADSLSPAGVRKRQTTSRRIPRARKSGDLRAR